MLYVFPVQAHPTGAHMAACHGRSTRLRSLVRGAHAQALTTPLVVSVALLSPDLYWCVHADRDAGVRVDVDVGFSVAHKCRRRLTTALLVSVFLALVLLSLQQMACAYEGVDPSIRGAPPRAPDGARQTTMWRWPSLRPCVWRSVSTALFLPR